MVYICMVEVEVGVNVGNYVPVPSVVSLLQPSPSVARASSDASQGLFQRSLGDEFGNAIRGDISKLTASYGVIIVAWDTRA